MRKNSEKTAVGGCCMGIPFGCSSVLLLFIGAVLWQRTGSAWFLSAALVPSAIALVIGMLAAVPGGLRR